MKYYISEESKNDIEAKKYAAQRGYKLLEKKHDPKYCSCKHFTEDDDDPCSFNSMFEDADTSCWVCLHSASIIINDVTYWLCKYKEESQEWD